MENEINDVVTEPIKNVTCPVTGYQTSKVQVPVTVTPYATTSATKTKCCGDPIITPGTDSITGEPNGSCSFTITQYISIAVPVEFGADASVGDTYVDCEYAGDTENCNP